MTEQRKNVLLACALMQLIAASVILIVLIAQSNFDKNRSSEMTVPSIPICYNIDTNGETFAILGHTATGEQSVLYCRNIKIEDLRDIVEILNWAAEFKDMEQEKAKKILSDLELSNPRNQSLIKMNKVLKEHRKQERMKKPYK